MPNERIDFLRLSISPYTQEFLNCSWEWLNDPETKALTATPDFSRDQQLAWYSSLASKKDYLIWGVKLDDKPIGVFGVKNIRDRNGEYWGYIGSKELWGSGIGTWMMQQVLELSTNAGLSRIYLKVLKNNVAAIRLYGRMRFNKYDSDQDFDWMERNIDCRNIT
ncbi:GNAT family N-acetyltransferase [Massilia sp. 2TAF26]|uniref:GNAT family N-acetyltransferase n=1 Tax=Massilia sp. 2TAF26 TaxID=3233012 RepID=UPI003F9D9261